ncbi:MAG: hypothetical protein ACI89L_001939 [Phycisphaerales bacterium]|jgi:hypothetical protein
MNSTLLNRTAPIVNRALTRAVTPARSAALMLAMTALPVLAQDDAAALRPPNPGQIKGPIGVLVLILLAILAGLLIFAATLPSKRGHQD